MPRRRVTLPILFSACLFAVAGCARPDLPDLPKVASNELLPAIQRHILEARNDVLFNPNAPDVNGHFAMVLAAYGFHTEADVLYRRARLLAPDVAQWAYLHAYLLADVGRTHEAIDTLRELQRTHPGLTGVQVRLAEQLDAIGNVEESRAVYEGVIELHSDETAAQFGLGKVLLSEGNLDAAVEHLQAALSQVDDVGDIHFVLATAYRLQGDEESTRRHLALFERFKHRNLSDLDPARGAVGRLHRGDRPHLRRAEVYVAEGRLREAVVELTHALEINPSNVLSHVHLVWLYGLLGSAELAESHYGFGLRLDDKSVELHFNWGHVLVQTSRYDEAEAVLERAVELQPSHVGAITELAYALDQQGKRDEAHMMYARAIEIAPDDPNAHYLLGKSLGLERHNGEALIHLGRALESEDGRTPLFLRTLAGVHANAGDDTRAMAALQRAHRLSLMMGDDHQADIIENDIHALGTGPELQVWRHVK